ncbi:hypothetical protein ACFX19_020058 [Malus domestica]
MWDQSYVAVDECEAFHEVEQVAVVVLLSHQQLGVLSEVVKLGVHQPYPSHHVRGGLQKNPSFGDDTELTDTAKCAEKQLRVFLFGAVKNFSLPRNDF